MRGRIPVIDLFAGPGGLGEGFSAAETVKREKAFSLSLSIERDRHACETLCLRSFFRGHERGKVPPAYYDFLRGRISLQSLYAKHNIKSHIANTRVCHKELGGNSENYADIRERIKEAIDGDEKWVLIGGPPCQAYSIAGRSRNRGNIRYDPKQDIRQHLYLEYLQIIADHWPAVFVMENVKGLLSATLDNQRIFQRIVEDLSNPRVAIKRENRPLRGGNHKYYVHSFVQDSRFSDGDLRSTLIKAERYGIPQARHRVILLGIRDDLAHLKPKTLAVQSPVDVSRVLDGMPSIRSGLNRSDDSSESWISYLKSGLNKRWFLSGTHADSGGKINKYMRKILMELAPPINGRGVEFLPINAPSEYLPEWYMDKRLDGICNHSSRSHMPEDLYRYLYAACFAQVRGQSPTLRDFPAELLPKHENVKLALEEGGLFLDRFRVQVSRKPASTITSHIAKDGHYYIHPDPRQCRSLSVREAARIQTFPDNYFFVGPRTEQYRQVGNAVPPLLAKQIGEIVLDLLERAGAMG